MNSAPHTSATHGSVIRLTWHAIERFRERFPDVPPAEARSTILADVRAAVDAGRKSKTRPRFASVDVRFKSDSRHRYCWDEARQRCYVLRRVGRAELLDDGHPAATGWQVITVWGRSSRAPQLVEAAALVRASGRGCRRHRSSGPSRRNSRGRSR